MCKCVAIVDKQLAPKNTRIAHIFTFSKTMDVGTGIGVVTEKVDRTKRAKPVVMLATFCPFCGKKL